MPNNNPTGKGGFGERPQHINRKGKPKSFDALRALAQQIAHEVIETKDGTQRTAVDVIVRKLAAENPERFLEIAFGKVPNPVEVSGPGGGPIKVKGYGIFNPDDWDGETETEPEDADGEEGD